LEIKEKETLKDKLEQTIIEYEHKVALQREKLTSLAKDAEIERQKERDRIQREKEERKRKEDEARLRELQLKAEEERAKSVILNKNKVRPAVTFSFFGSVT
jgi:uncharacterized membrane protein (DUF106 family)